MNVSCNEILGRVVEQAVCNWLVATEHNIQSQGSPGAFCTGKKQRNYILISENLVFPYRLSFHECVICNFINLI